MLAQNVAEGADFDDVIDQIAELDIVKDEESQQEEDHDIPANEADAEQEEGVTEEAEPEYLELKHNGRPVKLGKDEVIEYAQKGFDYTTKTQELAEQRRNVEQYAQHVQQQAVFQQQFSQEIAELTAMDMQLQRYQQVDWPGYTDQDPVEATKAWQKFQLLQGHRNQKAGELGQRQAQMQGESARMTEMRLAEASAQLERELGKEWNADTRKALKAVGLEYGYSDEELSGILDHRAVKVLYDAMKWRQMQANKPALTRKVQDAPRMAKPGNKPVSQNNAKRDMLQKQARKTGSLKDVASLLEMDI